MGYRTGKGGKDKPLGPGSMMAPGKSLLIVGPEGKFNLFEQNGDLFWVVFFLSRLHLILTYSKECIPILTLRESLPQPSIRTVLPAASVCMS